MNGYGIAIIPFSWAIGIWRKPNKTLFAVGPFRLVRYSGLSGWKAKSEKLSALARLQKANETVPPSDDYGGYDLYSQLAEEVGVDRETMKSAVIRVGYGLRSVIRLASQSEQL